MEPARGSDYANARKVVELALERGVFAPTLLQTQLGKNLEYIKAIGKWLEEITVLGPETDNGQRLVCVHNIEEFNDIMEDIDERRHTLLRKYIEDSGVILRRKRVANGRFSPNDPVVRKAVEISISKGKFSTAMLQTYLGKGHRFVSDLAAWFEEIELIGPQNGNKPRDMLVKNMQEFEQLANYEKE